MPRTEHFQPSVSDWSKVKADWLTWIQGGLPDIKNLSQFASHFQLPYGTVAKKTARWKREELDKLQATMTNLKPGPSKGKYITQKVRIGNSQRGRVNASPSPLSSLVFTDEFRQARGQAKQALNAAMSALIEEVQNGSGPSRITAIKELLDRAGLAKDTEKKDEASPYEMEETGTLQKRLIELLGQLPMFNSTLQSIAQTGQEKQENDPTTFRQEQTVLTITPSSSLASKTVEMVQGSAPVVESGEPHLVLTE